MTPCDYCSGTRSLSDQPALGPCVCAPWSRVEHLAPGVTLYCGDSLEVLPALVGRHDVASVVTDPPYGLGAHPDPRELLRCWLGGRPYAAKGAGFMGKEWDAFVPGPEIWRPVMDMLPPGGHMLAAFGTRTYDLGTLAVRLADAEIRDLIAWVYGSGFPKSLDVSKAIDAAAGAVRTEVVGKSARHGGGVPGNGTSYEISPEVPMLYAPATDAARQWDGWGTALKPAIEPWVLARKPLAGTVAANILAHGVGALNIDACRVETDDGYATNRVTQGGDHFSIGSDEKTRGTTFEPNAAGRWPANLCHDGSDEVLAGFPAAPGQLAKASTSDTQRAGQNVYGDMMRGSNGSEPRNDTGSAARFFYCAKASKRDRDEGMDGAPEVTTDDGRAVKIDNAYLRKNHHPTVKPEALMAYLCRLITPPGGTVLDPFMGSGSTGKAAVRAGFGFVGIERDPAYFEIAVRRVRAAMLATIPSPATRTTPPSARSREQTSPMCDLITSLEQAGEGSLALDIELMTLLGGARDVGDGVYYGPNTETWHTSEAAENEGYRMLPAPSRSLDAALALASRVLPYTTFRIDLDQRPRVWAFDKEDCFGLPSTIGSRVRDWEAYADAQTPALALCIAIIRATNPKGQPNV